MYFKNDKLIDKVAKLIDKPNRLFSILAAFIGFSFFLIPIIITKTYSGIIFDSSTGAIGDTIGGIVNPIISLVAVIFTFMAFYVQYKANQIQNANFQSEKNRLLLESRESRLKSFEGTLFELIKNQQNIIEYLDFQNGQYTKRKFFEFLMDELKYFYTLITNPNLEEMIKNPILYSNDLDNIGIRCKEIVIDVDHLNNATNGFKIVERLINAKNENRGNDLIIPLMSYRLLFAKYHNYYNHYFKNLLELLKLVERERIYEKSYIDDEIFIDEEHQGKIYDDLDEKFKRYTSMIEANLSSCELLLLFYHSLCFDEFKYFMHQYNFLHNLDLLDLLDKKHGEFYSESAGLKKCTFTYYGSRI